MGGKEILELFLRIDPWRKDGWWRIQIKPNDMQKTNIFQCMCFKGSPHSYLSVVVSYFITYFNSLFYNWTLCHFFFSPLFIQTILWKFQGPRPAPAELNGILDIEVNGNRTGKAVRLIRYTIPQHPLKFCWTLPFKQIKLVNSEAMKCHYYISTLKPRYLMN